ncbi:hypothetical protein SNR37_002011 [Agarivorans aestuarii]|uniref:Uncharacterized protein n=1 Tax=Agarivorans aestuarii TaxID=1563703 RepID=A0ABU7FZU9_9ALTE|nr:hypothetical protein [Agarivorans aestuarii]MEE1672608.1 hypothetical protein [Agarivorans aestuarii]
MSSAEIRITNTINRHEAICSKLPFTAIEKGDVVISSRLDKNCSVNEHLVWLWGKLNNERRFLKSLQQDGANIICNCKASKGKHRILPNGAEMLHLLNVELVLEIK